MAVDRERMLGMTGFALIELLDDLAGAERLVDDDWPADVRRCARRALRGEAARDVEHLAVDDAQADELQRIVDEGNAAAEQLQALDIETIRRRVHELQAARESVAEARAFGITRLG